MNLSEPKVIIFTSAYNAEKTIERTIKSILNQGYKNYEYYILENGCSDRTREILRDYREKYENINFIKLHINDIRNAGAIWNTIIHFTSAKYIVWCDSDDEYESDFLETTVHFAEENELELVATGYSKVNAYTNELISSKTIENDLIISNELFEEKFIEYRGFMSYLWGKLYSVDLLKRKNNGKTIETEEENQIANDSIKIVNLFLKADRVGIIGKPMYKYYQYPNSVSNQNIHKSLESYRALWRITKEYIESYGEISKKNNDFLYAIKLSLVDEVANKIFNSDMETNLKLDCLNQVFDDEVFRKVLTGKFDPVFVNLGNRKVYVNDYISKIKSFDEIEKFEKEHIELVKLLMI